MVTKLNNVYRCAICGNVVEVINVGGGTLVCCGQPMILETENFDQPELNSTHLPVAENDESGTMVTVGAEPHPMSSKHHLQWIGITVNDGHVAKHYLGPHQPPQAFFFVPLSNITTLRAYCNLHGLWETKLQ